MAAVADNASQLSEDEQYVNMVAIFAQSITTSLLRTYLVEHSNGLYAYIHNKLAAVPSEVMNVSLSGDAQDDGMPCLKLNVVYNYDEYVVDCIHVQWGRIIWAVVMDAIGRFEWAGADDTPDRRLLRRALGEYAPIVMHEQYMHEAVERLAVAEGRARPPQGARGTATMPWRDWNAWDVSPSEDTFDSAPRTKALNFPQGTHDPHPAVFSPPPVPGEQRYGGSLRGECDAALSSMLQGTTEVLRLHVAKTLAQRLAGTLPPQGVQEAGLQRAINQTFEMIEAAEGLGQSAEGLRGMCAALQQAKKTVDLRHLGEPVERAALVAHEPILAAAAVQGVIADALGITRDDLRARFPSEARRDSAVDFLHFHLRLVRAVLGNPEHGQNWGRRTYPKVWQALRRVILAANPEMQQYVGEEEVAPGGAAAGMEGGPATNEPPPEPSKSTDTSAFTALSGRCSLKAGMQLVGAPLPSHLHTLPHPLAVRQALGLGGRTSVLPEQYADSGMQHAPRPVHGAAGFTLGGHVYMHGGVAQQLAPDVLTQSIHSRLGADALNRLGTAVRMVIRKLGFTVMGHLFDAQLQQLPLPLLLGQAVRRALLTDYELRMVQDILTWAANGQVGEVKNNSQARDLLSALSQLQSLGQTALYTQNELYMLAPGGSHFTYTSEQMDAGLNKARQGSLDRLVRSARNHGAAAEWVRVPSQNTLPAMAHHTAVAIPCRADPRVVLLNTSDTQHKFSILRISVDGAASCESPDSAMLWRPTRGASAVKLRGENTVLLYSGVPFQPTMLRWQWDQAVERHRMGNGPNPGPWVDPDCDMWLLDSRRGHEGVWGVPHPKRDTVGAKPCRPTAGHGAVMLRGGNMVVWGGYTESGSWRSTVHVATLLDCKAACGVPVVPSDCPQFRVVWSNVALGTGSSPAPTPRKSFFMHAIPGSDAFMVFGGETRGGGSAGDLFVCTVASSLNPKVAADWAALAEHPAAKVLPEHLVPQVDIQPDDKDVTFFEATWTKAQVTTPPLPGSTQGGAASGEAPAVEAWSAPRHAAAAAVLGRRIIMYGGMVRSSAKGGDVADAADPSEGRPMETDFSTRVMSKAYNSRGGARTSGGAGVHQWGVLRPVHGGGGAMRSDTQVIKLGGEGVSLAPSTHFEDMHWLWAGVSHARCITSPDTAAGGASWRIEAGAGGTVAATVLIEDAAAPPAPLQPASGSAALDGMTASGRDDSGLSSAAVADLVLLCAPAVGTSGNANIPLAAHKCMLAAVVPWFAKAIAEISDPPAPDLHDDDVSPGSIPPPPPAGVPMAKPPLEGTEEGPHHGGDDDDSDSDGDGEGSDAVAPPPLEKVPSLTLQRSLSMGPGTAGDSADVQKPPLATPLCSAEGPLVLSLPFAPADAMQHVLLWVYTGQADIPQNLVPAVWMVCEVLGLSPIARRVMQRVRAAAIKDKKASRAPRANGLPASFHVTHKDVHWKEEALFQAGRSLLGTPDMHHTQFAHALCSLPLVNIDTQLARHCCSQLSSKLLRTTEPDPPRILVSGAPLKISNRGGNARTVAALQWLNAETEHTDAYVETRVPTQNTPTEGATSELLSDAPPAVCWMTSHAAVLAARSKLWRGQLCSEHFARSGAGTDAVAVSLGAAEDIPLSLEESGALLQYVYGDATSGVSVAHAPQLLPLASLHSLHRLATVCERAIVSGYDLDDLQSALGIYAYGQQMGSAGDRLCRIAAAALQDAAPNAAVLAAAVKELQEEGWLGAAGAAKLMKLLGQ